MEADYELNNSLDANSDKYWKALRSRAGMDTDYQKTINATDLSKELDFARYSGQSSYQTLCITSVGNAVLSLQPKGFV